MGYLARVIQEKNVKFIIVRVVIAHYIVTHIFFIRNLALEMSTRFLMKIGLFQYSVEILNPRFEHPKAPIVCF